MRRVGSRRILGVAAAAAVVAAALVGDPAPARTSADTAAAQTIRSKDGRLTLKIPAGALPKGTKVSIAIVPRSAWPKEVRRSKVKPAGAVYRLRPGGVRFAKPLTITLRVPGFAPAKGVPALALATRSERGKWQFLGTRQTSLRGSTAVATGTLRHFSSFYVFDTGTRVQLVPPRVLTRVGAWWNARLVVRDGELHATLTDWNASGVVTQPVGDTAGDLGIFSCESAGTGTYSARVSVE